MSSPSIPSPSSQISNPSPAYKVQSADVN